MYDAAHDTATVARLGVAFRRSVALAEPAGGPSALPVPAPTWLAGPGPLPGPGSSWPGPGRRLAPGQGGLRESPASPGPLRARCCARERAPARWRRGLLSGRAPRWPGPWRADSDRDPASRAY